MTADVTATAKGQWQIMQRLYVQRLYKAAATNEKDEDQDQKGKHNIQKNTSPSSSSTTTITAYE